MNQDVGRVRSLSSPAVRAGSAARPGLQRLLAAVPERTVVLTARTAEEAAERGGLRDRRRRMAATLMLSALDISGSTNRSKRVRCKSILENHDRVDDPGQQCRDYACDNLLLMRMKPEDWDASRLRRTSAGSLPDVPGSGAHRWCGRRYGRIVSITSVVGQPRQSRARQTTPPPRPVMEAFSQAALPENWPRRNTSR